MEGEIDLEKLSPEEIVQLMQDLYENGGDPQIIEQLRLYLEEKGFEFEMGDENEDDLNDQEEDDDEE